MTQLIKADRLTLTNPDMQHAPLVMTLRMNKEAQDYFNALRKQYFPAHLNYLEAHLTLFHQLPNTESIRNELQLTCEKFTFDMEVTEPYHTGFGVAFRLQAKALINLHGNLQEAFRTHLSAQDRQIIRPHVTIQNKVSPETSKQLLKFLQKDFVSFDTKAIGIDTWEYLNGPWRHQDFLVFALPLYLITGKESTGMTGMDPDILIIDHNTIVLQKPSSTVKGFSLDLI